MIFSFVRSVSHPVIARRFSFSLAHVVSFCQSCGQSRLPACVNTRDLFLSVRVGELAFVYK
jgi:hypothetical protein